MRPTEASDTGLTHRKYEDLNMYVQGVNCCNNIMLLYIYLLTKYDEPNLNITMYIETILLE